MGLEFSSDSVMFNLTVRTGEAVSVSALIESRERKLKNIERCIVSTLALLGCMLILFSPVTFAAEKKVFGKKVPEVKATAKKAPEAKESDVRVIEDTFIISDPTVAKDEKLLFGVSVDYFSTTYDFRDPDIPGTIKASEPGITVFVAKGNFTTQLAYRTGSTYLSANGVGQYAGVSVTGDVRTTMLEATMRWLARNYSTSFVTPYFGVAYYKQSDSANVTATNVNTGATASESIGQTVDALAPSIGGIFPINEKIGFRLEVRRYFAFKDNLTDNRNYLTVYYNLTKSLNAQLGYQSWPSYNATGVFMLLGYTFR